MRKLIIASALASTGIAAPALAQERGPYVGVDAGFVKPQQLNLTLVNSAGSLSNGERLRHKHGYDVDGVIGYDFGMFRLEGEVAYKHARLKSAMLDPNALAAVLLSPVTNTIVPAATGRSNVSSGMINALLDLGPSSGVNGSIGLGAGAARANYRAGLVPSNALNFSGQDRAFAWQALAEVRFPVSASVDEVPGLSERRCRSEVSLFPNSEAELRAILRYNLHNRTALSAAGQVQIQQPAGERRL